MTKEQTQPGELKPCPCGAGGHITGSNRLDGRIEAIIECDECCGFTVSKWGFYDRKNHTPVEMSAFHNNLYDEARKAWNTRAQPELSRLYDAHRELRLIASEVQKVMTHFRNGNAMAGMVLLSGVTKSLENLRDKTGVSEANEHARGKADDLEA